MNSQGHRENILNSNYTEIGFGYSHLDSSKYRHYWVQVFGKSNGKKSVNPTYLLGENKNLNYLTIG